MKAEGRRLASGWTGVVRGGAAALVVAVMRVGSAPRMPPGWRRTTAHNLTWSLCGY